MTTQREKLRDDVQFRIPRFLQENPEMSQCVLAKAVGISTGGIRYVLSALLEKGQIKLGKFTEARHKQRFAYILTPKGITLRASLTRRFLARKMAEYNNLKAEIEEVTAGLSDKDQALICARQTDQ